jgi:G3E family GTPase
MTALPGLSTNATISPRVTTPMTEDEEELERLLAVESTEQTSAPIPVTVLTGFLGAGKTTLVNRILSEEHGLRIAVLVNDFGEVDVDSELIIGIAAQKVSLANGCVCCEVREDLLAAIDAVLISEAGIDAIVLEASGVAEPLTIARTFVDAAYQQRLRLDGIIAVVDAEQLPAQVADPVTSDLVYAQIGCSDLVLLNKIDLADRDRLRDVRDFVTQRLESVRMIETLHADVPLSVLLGARPADVPADDHPDHHHHPGFVSWVYRRERPFAERSLQECIANLPESVYRIKGFIHTTDHPLHRVLVQAVGMRSAITPFDEPDAQAPCSTLVIIARRTVDRAGVDAALDAC